MEIVAKKYNCDYLPVSFNGPTKFRNTTLYTSMDSMKSNYNPFESLKRDALQDYGENGICMFVCHPGYLDAYIIRTSSLLEPRTLEVEMACNQKTKDWLKENIIAHRGIHDNKVLENSLLSFKLAIDKNYIIELDVRLTKDNKVIVYHDSILKRLFRINKESPIKMELT